MGWNGSLRRHLRVTPPQTPRTNPALGCFGPPGLIALYNLVIGYMLEEKSQPDGELMLFFIAMALHFLVIDFSFRDHYQDVYHDKGRWLLSVAVIVGWVAGTFLDIPDVAMSVAVAFVAGGIMLNALKEELPEERQGRFLPFLLGAALYTAVALAYAK